MSTQQPVSASVQGQPESGRPVASFATFRWFELSWPGTLACVALIGFAFAAHGSALPGIDLRQAIRRCQEWFQPPPPMAAQEALVITADRATQLTFVTALSPRGFHPLLAGSEREVLAQLRAYPNVLRLAVIDSSMPDYARIAGDLKHRIPPNRIIVLKGSPRPEEICPLLLDRL